MTIFRTLEQDAERVARYDERLAAQMCACVERAEADRRAFWDAPLDLAASVIWSGYTTGHLRRMISDGTIVPTNNDRIRRRDLPVKPGHRFVLAMEVTGECKGKARRHRLLNGGCSHWQILPTFFDATRHKMIAKLGETGGYRLQFGWLPE